MTLHLNDELHTLIKEKRGKGDSIIGTIDLADLVDYVALKSGALPAQPNSPALTSCQAELEAEKRMREVEGATDKKSSKHDGKSIDAMSVTSHDHGKPTAAHPKVDQLVKDEVNLQMKTATSPESELAYSVAARADQKSTPTFELRAGPSDVTSYHDFNTLQIAFEHVWTEIFDGQLASLGEQLYHEYVKLKEFIGANDPDRPIHTIDDLRRLMDEVRKLAQFTDFVPTELTPSTVVGTGGDDITKAVADAARVGAAIATGGMSEVVNQFARLARGMVKLTWASFPGPLADGDVISVTID